MSNASLAIKYRPQTFADVVGQDMVKTVLSRAALEDKVAPAYLLSGTRGVGKTTIARIFAKALNCVQAPTGEPCNQCENCRRITLGSFVDVVEIDGASNRGIDDIRRLRDAVGYAPLEGRYKVFIIDEAHMLTKEAFNALLKTLEEPPARVSFILATTEQHKFPITIISRCQHFVFKQVPEQMLFEHLQQIMDKEGASYEPEALTLIARRAQGSVRDAMSLLGQSLALIPHQDKAPGLSAGQTRSVLGLAGKEAQEQLLEAIAGQDLGAIHALTCDLLSQGIDIGFFLREFAALWRNLFLVSQTGAKIIPQLHLGREEGEKLVRGAGQFAPAQIHAAWQMTQEAQRKILTSLEPASGLELLLYNLAMLPRLVPIRELQADAPLGQPAASAPTRSTDAAAEKKNSETGISRKPSVPPAPEPRPGPEIGMLEMEPDEQPVYVYEDEEDIPPLAEDPGQYQNENFLDYCRANGQFGHLLQQCVWRRQNEQIEILTSSLTQLEQLTQHLRALDQLALDWSGRNFKVVLLPPQEERLTEGEIKEKLADHPTIKALEDLYDARFA